MKKRFVFILFCTMFDFLAASEIAAYECSCDYRSLYPGMNKESIEKILGLKAGDEKLFFDNGYYERMLPFVKREEAYVFPVIEEKAKGLLVVTLNKNKRLEAVFYVNQGYFPAQVSYLWPVNGKYERQFREIRLGDNIKELTKKIGWRSPDDYYQDRDGTWVVCYTYSVRGADVKLKVEGETGNVWSVSTYNPRTYEYFEGDFDKGVWEKMMREEPPFELPMRYRQKYVEHNEQVQYEIEMNETE